jgi:hypothetical protein
VERGGVDDNIDAAHALPDEVVVQDRADMARKGRIKKIKAFDFALTPLQGPDETFSEMPGASSSKHGHSGGTPFLLSIGSALRCAALRRRSQPTRQLALQNRTTPYADEQCRVSWRRKLARGRLW